MPNAFTLFGELRADTAAFERSLQRADREIKQTERNLTQLEAKTKAFGVTSATTGRAERSTIDQDHKAKAHRCYARLFRGYLAPPNGECYHRY
jgi:hypothetical protein